MRLLTSIEALDRLLLLMMQAMAGRDYFLGAKRLFWSG
jgi:hypothetical protein